MTEKLRKQIRKGYYYLHTNGELNFKNEAVMTFITPIDYFDSPLVKRWWHITTRNDHDKMIKEIEEIKENK